MIGLMKLRRARRSVSALLFALVLVPLIGFLGLAIDFGMVAMAKSQIGAAADAAALKAVTAAAAAYRANPSSDFVAAGQAAGLSFFQGTLGSMVFGTATSPAVVVNGSNGSFTATVTAQAKVPTIFAQVFNFNNFTVHDTSATSLTDPKYVAIQVLMDTSASMGIMTDTVNGPAKLLAAIQDRITKTYNNKAPAAGDLFISSAANENIITIKNYAISPGSLGLWPCAFACHNDNTTTGPNGKSNDFYGVAEDNKVQLRIDVLRDAVQQMLQQVNASSNAPYFQFGLYGFTDSLNTIFPLSTNLGSAETAAGNINVTPMPPYCATGPGDTPPLCGEPATAASGPDGRFREGAVPNTSFETAAAQLITATLTPPPTQNGVSSATPLRFLFIITDGVDDYTTITARDGSCCNQYIFPFNATDGVSGAAEPGPNACDKFKSAGVTVLVLYTPYEPVNVDTYLYHVAPITQPLDNSAVTQALQACATSSADFFQASNASEIKAALAKMLAIASAKVGQFTQ